MPPKLVGDVATIFQQDNPKKAGTKAHSRYEQYKHAKTVDEATRLGATKPDLTNDHKFGYLVLPGELPSPRGAKRACPDSAASTDAAAASGAAKRRAGAPALAPPSLPPSAEAAEAPLVAPSVSWSAGTAAATEAEVDLSFAKFDNKPMKFVKRTMGEARKLLCDQGVEEGRKLGYEFRLLDRDNLAKWAVRVRDLNPEGKLLHDLKRLGLDPSVDLEFCLPDGFPLEPPFARVVYPQLAGGYVFEHGGICFEPLTTKGWAPSMTLPALAVAIKGILDFGEVRCTGAGDKQARVVRQYTEAGARRDHQSISSAHRGGEGSTYGSLKRYKS